eukprot:511621_1
MQNEVVFTTLVAGIKHYEGHEYTNIVAVIKEDEKEDISMKERVVIQIQKPEHALKEGVKIVTNRSSITMSNNFDKVTRKNIIGDNGIDTKIELSNYQIVVDEKFDFNEIETIYNNEPKPVVPKTIIDQCSFMGIFLVEKPQLIVTSKQNKALKGEITNGKDWKFPLYFTNLPVSQRDPTETELLLLQGVFRIIRDNSGFQVQGHGKVIYTDKYVVYPDSLIERKRIEYLPGNALECCDKDILESDTLVSFVKETHGLKVKKFSKPLKVYCKMLGWKGIRMQPKTVEEEPWWNGTGFFCDTKDSKSIRLKIKNNVMKDLIVLKPACEAVNYASDFELFNDARKRITNKDWIVELMYVYCEKQAEKSNSKEPPRKKQKISGASVPQCVTGYINIISMRRA